MRTAIRLAVLAIAALAAAPPASPQKAGCDVSGTVLNGDRKPIPGLTVYLVHPRAGRSHARTTTNSGYFTFARVPRQQDAYYLEIYWGSQLQYRKPVTIDGDTNLGSIVLR